MTHSKHIYSTVPVVWMLKVSISNANIAYVKQVFNLLWQAHALGEEPRREVIKWKMHRSQCTAAAKTRVFGRISSAHLRSEASAFKTLVCHSFHTLLNSC